MAARRNLQSLSNLVSAITRLSHTNSDGNSEEAEDTDVEATKKSLFPSTNGRASQSTSTQDSGNSQSRVATSSVNVSEQEISNSTSDRRFRDSFERFVADRKKRSKSVKTSSSNSSKKAKCQEQQLIFSCHAVTGCSLSNRSVKIIQYNSFHLTILRMEFRY